jgi:hypothetical protein
VVVEPSTAKHGPIPLTLMFAKSVRFLPQLRGTLTNARSPRLDHPYLWCYMVYGAGWGEVALGYVLEHIVPDLCRIADTKFREIHSQALRCIKRRAEVVAPCPQLHVECYRRN